MKQRSSAFTLIELLVVIAIIAILAAILFPVFAQAKAAAKKTADLSNTKQHALGITMYAGDADDTFPRSWYKKPGMAVWGWNTPTTWREAVMPYIKNGQKAYDDGTNKVMLADGGLWDTPAKPGSRGSYGANQNIMPGACMYDSAGDHCDQTDTGYPTGKTVFPSVSMTVVDAPAQVAMSWTIGIHPDWNASGDAPDGSWWWWGGNQWPPVFDGPNSGAKFDADAKDFPYYAMPRYRYTDGLNASFADGHGKYVKKGSFNWCKYVYVKGKTTNWNENWDWLFDAGSYCSAYAR